MTTYPQALLLAVLAGLGTYAATAAGRYATAVSAVPYGIGAALFVAFFACAAVAYKKGQPNRK